MGRGLGRADVFLNLTIAYYESNQFDKMPAELDRALKHYQNKSADTKLLLCTLRAKARQYPKSLGMGKSRY